MNPDSKSELISLVEKFLKEANEPLLKRRVIPPSAYKTYLKVGKDFEGFYLMSLESYQNLEKSLPRLFPRFFPENEKLFYWKHPSMYIFNLLTRAIDLTDWNFHQELGLGNIQTSLVEGLINTFEEPDTQLYKCREVSHLTTENREVFKIKHLEVRPSPEDANSKDSIQWVAGEIRGAFVEWDERISLSIEKPLSLITHRMKGKWEYIDSQYSDKSKEIGQFILACRLIYNATIRNYWEIMGSPDPLSPYTPTHYRFEDYDGLISLIKRNAEIKRSHIKGIEWMIDEIDFAFAKPELETATPLEIGLSNFTKSFYSGKNIRAIADLATCLESIMIEKQTSEIGLKLQSRTAALIYTETDSIQKLYSDIRNLYELRSILIHGGAVDETRLRKILSKIVVRSDVSTNEKLALAVYRFQDITRRALLSRLVLESREFSPWSQSNHPNIDALLADPDFRAECRNEVRNKLTDIGLEFAIAEAQPAKVTFVDS